MRARNEIGGEFWSIPQITNENDLFPENTIWTISGRVAQEFIIQDILARRQFKSVAIPSWCCHTMIQPFLRYGIIVFFYPVYVNKDGLLSQDLNSVMHCDGLLVLDYFGYITKPSSIDFDGIIIRDVTHSLFSTVHRDADYIFGSLRKWAGFWTGGYAWCKNRDFIVKPPVKTDNHYIYLRKKAMFEKSEYIQGRINNKQYITVYEEAEDYLETFPQGSAAIEDIKAAKKIDVEFLCNRRRQNADKLLSNLSDIALFPELQADDCPLFVPIFIQNNMRNSLRKHLIEQDIYCPVHWPVSESHCLTEQTREIYENELSLVCDQRYSESDMQRIINAVKGYMKE